MLGKMTVNDRAQLNGGFLGGPRNLANRELRNIDPMVKQADPEAGPPNLRMAEDPAMSCGTCVFHDGEMCEAHQVECAPEQVCDDHTPDSGGEAIGEGDEAA